MKPADDSFALAWKCCNVTNYCPSIHNNIYQQSFTESPFKHLGYHFLRSHKFWGASSASLTQTTVCLTWCGASTTGPKLCDKSRTKTAGADGWAHTEAHLCADGWEHIYLLMFKFCACPIHLATGNLHLKQTYPTGLPGFSVYIGQI